MRELGKEMNTNDRKVVVHYDQRNFSLVKEDCGR